MSASPPRVEERLQYARVLVELGEHDEAEREVALAMDEAPDDLTALNLFAKIKHIKGELSQAIACWAQLHARSPHNELALMCLQAILQLAKDPSRGAGDFLALGQFPLVRKPAAHVELEGALGLLLARRPEEARAACDRLAAKYRRDDRDLYKLAVLAKAWIAELTGDLALACGILEDLGTERGFETDTDRVLALARIYERIGTRERLERAVHVCRYLDRSFEKMSAQGRLMTLYRKLGDDERAREYERRFTESFERRMHRVSLADVARVGARVFLPIEQLRRVRTVHYSDDPIERTPRERAIEHAVRGEVSEARALFEGSDAPLDRKYLADLAALDGNAREARLLYLGALEGDPIDARALHWLLSDDGVASDERALAFFRRSDVRAALTAHLEAALRVEPRRASLWRDMAGLRTFLGDPAEAARCAERAQAIEEATRRDASSIGRVLAAAVYHFVGKAKGLIHQIWVDRKPVSPGRGGFLHAEDVLGNVTVEMKQSTRNTFFAVREYARSRFPFETTTILDYDYTYKVTKEDEPSGGSSAGLPTALAFLSVFLQRPVPQDMAFSGVVIADAHDVLVVRHVGEAEFKLKAAYNRNLRRLLLPRDNRVDVQGNPQLPRALAEDLVGYVSSLNEAVTETWGEDAWTR
jgi:tetratricopeptide (TPR) repeat protein